MELVRRCPWHNTYEGCVRKSSVTAPHHQEVSPRGAKREMSVYISCVEDIRLYKH
jgi:hypothetical protein